MHPRARVSLSGPWKPSSSLWDYGDSTRGHHRGSESRTPIATLMGGGPPGEKAAPGPVAVPDGAGRTDRHPTPRMRLLPRPSGLQGSSADTVNRPAGATNSTATAELPSVDFHSQTHSIWNLEHSRTVTANGGLDELGICNTWVSAQGCWLTRAFGRKTTMSREEGSGMFRGAIQNGGHCLKSHWDQLARIQEEGWRQEGWA